MKTQIHLFLVLAVFNLTSCQKQEVKDVVAEDYVVISKLDSLSKVNDNKSQIPKPFVPQEMRWYSDLVFIMDSEDKDLVYQTELVSRNDNEKYDYTNYINLRPEYMTTIDSEDFVPFLKSNNDIFSIFSNKDRISNFFYIASETDTIKNKAIT